MSRTRQTHDAHAGAQGGPCSYVEAERLEHAVSDKLLAAIDRRLGHPVVDPHGDPIPSASGEVVTASTVPLDRVEAGGRGRITRVLDQDESFLRYVDGLGLKRGADVHLTAHDPLGETVELTLRDAGGDDAATPREPVVLGRAAARRLLVATDD